MSTVYVDAVGGLAGDMLVAALLDAGTPLSVVADAVAALGLGSAALSTECVWRGPFAATRFVVALPESEPELDRDQSGHSHAHGHDHSHGHVAPGPPAEGWRARSRRWADIDALLTSSALAPRVVDRARATFRRLAEAEGRVHGLPAEEVTFHEVGAMDSIVDIVGACAALEWHGAERIFVSVLPLGHGHVVGEHGWIPLPAPATVELLRGMPVEGRDIRGETVTPTGAALAAALMLPGLLPAMRISATGVGAGTWDPASHPNVVRVFLGEESIGTTSEIDELNAEVDTLSGELIPPLLEGLLAAGAVDAFVTPVLMKKGRSGWLLTALCPVGARLAVAEVLFREGHTLGVRFTRRERIVLDREHVPVNTAFGPVRVKVGRWQGKVLHAAPEFEDCRMLAKERGVTVVEVHAAALAAWSGIP